MNISCVNEKNTKFGVVNVNLLTNNTKNAFMKFLRFIFALMLICCCSTVVKSQNTRILAPGDTVNILWIGNSFTFFNDVPALVCEIAAQQRVTVRNTTVLKGGEKLAGHLANPELVKNLEKGGWDYIIMQEYSSGPAYSARYVMDNIYPAAAAIDSIAHVYSPEVETVFYMTWGHKNGNKRQTPYPLDDSYDLMQSRIMTTYIDLAYDLKAVCAPVGLAWLKVRKCFPEIELYIEDDFHPSLAGSWLAACTLFATLYRSPFIAAAPEGLPADESAVLQYIARQTVAANSKLIAPANNPIEK